MFICAISKECSQAGEKPIIVIDKKRKRTYGDGTTFGWEIVKELKLTPGGHAVWLERQLKEKFNEGKNGV